MRSGWIEADSFKLLLTALMPANSLAIRLSLCTGLRIGDVLSLETKNLKQRCTITEQKTGKRRRIYIPVGLYTELLSIAGRKYVFEGRLDWQKHRTRAAVWKDLKRVARLCRIHGEAIKANISPHSARKIYAVEQMRHSNIKHVQKLLMHENEAVTMLYAMADVLEAKKQRTRS